MDRLEVGGFSLVWIGFYAMHPQKKGRVPSDVFPVSVARGRMRPTQGFDQPAGAPGHLPPVAKVVESGWTCSLP